MKRICTRYCVYQILKIFPHHLWKQIWKLYFSQMCLEMLLKQLPSPSSSVAHRTWSPAAMEEEGGFPNRRLAAGLCSHSSGGSVWTLGKTSSLGELVQLGNLLPRGPAVSILGWAEPWLTSRQAGEGPTAPGGGGGRSLDPAPPAFLGFGGVSSSPQPRRQRRHQYPYVVTDPESVKQSSWPPQQVTTAAELKIHGHKSFLGCGHLCLLHPLTCPFPIPRSPEKVICAALPVGCYTTKLFPHPSSFAEICFTKRRPVL